MSPTEDEWNPTGVHRSHLDLAVMPNLNWQSSVSFVEEGKRKAAVQYYDGSLENRQTVTKDNTTKTTIVAENFYDNQDRDPGLTAPGVKKP